VGNRGDVPSRQWRKKGSISYLHLITGLKRGGVVISLGGTGLTSRKPHNRTTNPSCSAEKDSSDRRRTLIGEGRTTLLNRERRAVCGIVLVVAVDWIVINSALT